MMNKKTLGAIAFISIVMTINFPAAHSADEDTLSKIYGTLPAVSRIFMSKNGERAIFLQNVAGKQTLVSHSLLDLKKDIAIIPFGQGEINWVTWTSNDRILISLRYPSKRRAINRRAFEVMEYRLLSMYWKGGDVKSIYKTPGQKAGKLKPKYKQLAMVNQDRMIDELPDDPDHVLMIYNDNAKRLNHVFKVNIHTAKRSRVISGRDAIQNWTTDHNHIVRYGNGATLYADDTIARSIYRKNEQSDWIELYSFKLFTGKAKNTPPFIIEGLSDDPNIIYVSIKGEGGRTEFHKFDVNTKKTVERIAYNENFDIEGLIIDENGKIDGYYYFDETYVIIGKSKQYKMLNRFFNKTFPNASVEISNITKNKKIMTLKVSSPTIPAEYYHLNLSKGTMNIIAFNYDKLNVETLSSMKSISYKARDGQKIHGYLSVPVGSTGKNLPTIIMPHGGPLGVRDTWGFDYWVQFLTRQGYSVLQMNYRGSSGYGEDFVHAGYSEFGGKMIDDINDGTKWLISQGIANPKRICIMGGSYGGYAALQAPIKEKSLYKCAVAFAPVTDLGRMKKASKINGSYRYWKNIMESKERSFNQDSPYQNIDKLNLPILLAHGDNDRRVKVNQSRIMYKALKSENKDVKYIEFKGGNHHLSLQKYRILFLKEAGKFLEKNL